MTRWLIDTNVVSELRRPRPSRFVVDFFSRQPLDSLFISAATISELRYGAVCVDDLEKRIALEEWIDRSVRPMFEGRILPIDENVMLVWRLMLAEGRRTNHTFPQPDLILAATARHHGMIVASRDRRIFERAGVPIVDPWSEN